MTWLDRPMVGFDTETTGVDTSTDRIVTAAVITREGADGTPGVRTWLIDPGVEIPERATQVHGITTEMARANGQKPAEALEEIATLLASAMRSGAPVVAFNASYDITILENELQRHSLPTLAQRLGGREASIKPIVDPLVLDRHLDRYRRGKRKLIDICAQYGVQVDADSLHAADADVIATLDVVHAMARAFPELGKVDLADLHSQQIEAHRVWAENFRAWLTSKGTTDDLPSVNWPLARD